MEARPFAWILVLLLFSAAYAWSAWLQKGLTDKFTSLETNIREQSRQLDRISAIDELIEIQDEQIARMNAIQSMMVEQRGILDNALGRGLPVHMSEQWNKQLEELENQLSERALRPKNASQATEFVRAVSTLVSELSPLAESTYFARLARLRWAAVAFDALHRERGNEDTPFDHADQLRAIADAKPEGVDVDSKLEEELRQRAKELFSAAEETMLDDIVNRAQEYLDAEQNGQSMVSARLQEVYYNLEPYLDHAERREEIEDLREELGHRLSVHRASDLATALHEQWSQAKLLAGAQGSTYEAAASMLLRQVTEARAMTALSGLETSEYDRIAAEIQTAVDDLQDGFRRKYQKWALMEIMAFEQLQEEIKSASPSPSEVEPVQPEGDWIESLGKRLDLSVGQARRLVEDSVSRVVGTCIDESCRALQNAMINHLLPIDHVLLDPPLLKRYQRAFDKGWGSLHGRNEQTCVAIAAALVPKRGLRDIQDIPQGTDMEIGSKLRSHEGCG